MKKTLKKIKNILLDIVFPPLCISCKKNIKTKKEKSFNLCKNCQHKIRINPIKQIIKLKDSKYTHISALPYKNKIIKDSIHALKYNQIKSAFKIIKYKTIEPTIKKFINDFRSKDWSIVPVPIHSIKERERGFNQSNLIANYISKILKDNNINSEVQNNIISKTKSTKPQTKLTKEKRKKNLKNSFNLKGTNSLKSKNVIIVDDVFTTGSTVKEVIITLNETSYENLIIFTVARN